MTTLKTALACFALLALGLTYDWATGHIGVRSYVASVMITYALALIIAAIVEGVAMFCEWIFK